MKKLNLTLILSLLALMWIGCDVVEPPVYGCLDPLATNYNPANTLADGPCQGHCEYGPTAILGCTDPSALNYNLAATSDNCDCVFEASRKVLVEDYTGHTCANCPQAAEVLHDMEISNGGRIVPLAVHVGFFAQPQTHPDGSFASDFRTPEGDTWDTQFGISGFGLPGGMINRKTINGQYSVGREHWAQEAETVLELEPEALIDITHTYDTSNREVNATVVVNALTNLANSPYRLSVVLTEDSIVDWQLDNRLGEPEIEDYVHMHMLRNVFNGAWGSLVGGGNALTLGQSESVNLSLTLNSNFVDHNCNIVAFVYRDDTKEVIQAELVHLIEQ